VTFTFSEDPGSSFTAGDVVTEGGTLGPLNDKLGDGTSGNPYRYTATFTPSTGYKGPATIKVAAERFQDGFGNYNNAEVSKSISVDTQPPTVSIAAGTNKLTVANPSTTLTFTFSEDPVNSFTKNIITVPVGMVLGDLKAKPGSTTEFTATLTANAGLSAGADRTVSIGTGKFSDPNGNTNSQASNPLSFAVDTEAPTVAISRVDSKGTLKSGEKATLELNFSEAPVGLSAAAVQVQGDSKGLVSNLVKISDTKYQVDFAPSSGLVTQDITLYVANGAITDAAGNINQDGENANNQVKVAVSTQAPSVSSLVIEGYQNGVATANTLKAGDQIRVTATFTDNVTVTAGEGNAWPKYQLVLDNNTIREAVYSANASSSNKLVFIYTIANGASASTGDTDSTGGITANANALLTNGATVKDANNNNAIVATSRVDAGTNSIQVDTTPPTVTIARTGSGTLNALSTETITFTFSEDPVGFGAEDISIGTIGSSSAGTLVLSTTKVTNANGTYTYTGTFTPATGLNGAATISVKTGSFKDTAGNANAAVTPLSLPLNTQGVAPPTGYLKHDSSNDTGSDPQDSYTNNTLPSLTGTTQSGTTVFVELKKVGNSDVVWKGNVLAQGGSWTLPIAVEGFLNGATKLADGDYTWTVSAKDADNNTSATSTGTGFTIDTAPK
jgi:hypothetical protein